MSIDLLPAMPSSHDLARTGVRLLTAQSVTGASDHRVTIEGPTLESRELVAFQDATSDRQWLEYTAPKPIRGVQVVRVTTLTSPAMIGWREIEVVLAPESEPQACAESITNLALDRPATASASAPGSKPALAVDGDTETRWDAGAPAPRSIERDLGRETAISSVRLLPAGPADAAIAVVFKARDEADHTMVLGVVNQGATGTAGSPLRTLPGSSPSLYHPAAGHRAGAGGHFRPRPVTATMSGAPAQRCRQAWRVMCAHGTPRRS